MQVEDREPGLALGAFKPSFSEVRTMRFLLATALVASTTVPGVAFAKDRVAKHFNSFSALEQATKADGTVDGTETSSGTSSRAIIGKGTHKSSETAVVPTQPGSVSGGQPGFEGVSSGDAGSLSVGGQPVPANGAGGGSATVSTH